MNILAIPVSAESVQYQSRAQYPRFQMRSIPHSNHLILIPAFCPTDFRKLQDTIVELTTSSRQVDFFSIQQVIKSFLLGSSFIVSRSSIRSLDYCISHSFHTLVITHFISYPSMANYLCNLRIYHVRLLSPIERKRKRMNSNTLLTLAIFVDMTDGVLRYFGDSCEDSWDSENWTSGMEMKGRGVHGRGRGRGKRQTSMEQSWAGKREGKLDKPEGKIILPHAWLGDI